MSGTYPLTYRPKAVAMRTLSPTFVSTAHSLKRQSRTRGAHRWYFKYSYGPMVRSEWQPIVAFVDKQKGQYDKFTVQIAGLENPRGLVTGATQVDGAQAAGATTLNLKNLPLSVNGVFKAGDIFTLASHKKVYEIVDDANSDGAGKAAVNLNCPLFTGPANGEAFTWQNVAATVALIADDFERQWKGGLTCSGFDIEMIEDPY